MVFSVFVWVSFLDVNDNVLEVIYFILSNGKVSFLVFVNIFTGYFLVFIDIFNGLGLVGVDILLLIFYSFRLFFLVIIVVRDADLGINGEFLYSIRNGNEVYFFVFDFYLGYLFINIINVSSFIGSKWELEIVVEDRGSFFL